MCVFVCVCVFLFILPGCVLFSSNDEIVSTDSLNRGLLICQPESACPPWGGMYHMSKPSHGKYLQKITVFIA